MSLTSTRAARASTALAAVLTVCSACGDDEPGASPPRDAQVDEGDGSSALGPILGIDGGTLIDSGVATPLSLYRLRVGARSVYTIRSNDAGSATCSDRTSGSTWSEVVAVHTDGGIPVYDVNGPCAAGPQTLNQIRANGEDIEQWFSSEWKTILKAPLMDGVTFDSYTGYRFVWRSVPSVRVPAGTFHNCWLRESIGTSFQENVYCVDIGRVSMTAPGFTLELESYTP